MPVRRRKGMDNFILVLWCCIKFLVACFYTFLVKILSDALNLIVYRDAAAQLMLQRYFICIILYFALRPVLAQVEKWLEGKTILKLRMSFFEKFEYLDWKRFSGYSPGEFLYSGGNQIQEYAENKIKILSLCMDILATVVTILYATYLIHSAFFWVFLIIIPVCVVITLKAADVCISTHEKRHLARADFYGYMNEFANKLFEIKAAHGEEHYSGILCGALEQSSSAELGHQKSVLKYQTSEKLMHTVVFICSFALSVFLIYRDELAIGYLIAMVNYGERFFNSVLSLNYIKDIRADNAIIQKVLESQQISQQRQERENADVSPDFEVAVSFNQIKFAYDEKKCFSYNFTVRKGEKVKISGRSGSGKTTLLQLVTGLLQPSSGHVCFFDQDAATISYTDLLSHIAIMTQRPYIVDGSVMDNILWGEKGIPEEQVIAVLREHDMLDLIYEKDGTHKIVAGYGKNLSGGEKQRISLVRTLIKPAWLYLLDEPFSNLDSENKALCLQLIRDLCGDQTVIIISHDDSVDSYVERVINFGAE